MGSISLRNVGVTATVPLFSNLNLLIADGDRVGLVAGNGNGKTTLLRLMAGQGDPTTGEIVRSRGLTVGYVEQDVPPAMAGLTLYEAVRQALPAADRDSESWRVDVALDELETPTAMHDRLVSELSGGWQRIALLARCWINQPDALLLDEPTNHLNLAKLFLVERWINNVARHVPMVIASHDRDFLDATTNRTLFLRPETSRYVPLSYSAARETVEQDDRADAARFERDLKEAGKLRQQARKLTNIGINSGSDLLTVKSKQLRDRAGKIEAAARAGHQERSGEIRLSNSGTHARLLIGIEDATVTTPAGAPLFKIGKLHLFQGDRLVLLAPNGAGKSQFVRTLRAAIDGADVPGFRATPSLVLGYVDQAMSQLPAKGSPLDFITSAFDTGDHRAKSLLAAAGFLPEKQTQPIGVLSFGQRARLGLLALRLREPNFYLLDEPTNHVDIAGQDKLRDEIIAHGATCMVVSHDRRFVRDIGTRFAVIEKRKLTEVDGPEDFFRSMADAAE